MKHLLTTKSLTKNEILNIFNDAQRLQKEIVPLNKQIFVANLFMESSTRTKTSFTVAQRKLGLEVLNFTAEQSSMTKGETLYDTVKTFEAIGAQMLVIRDSEDHWYESIVENINIPLINAGAGKFEHPTQSLLDAYTIYKEFGHLMDLKIVIAGDIKHSRVARSNIQVLNKLGAKIYLSAPDEFIDETLQYPHVSMDEAVQFADCLMLLRVQHERHEQLQTTTNFLDAYGLTIEREQQMKEQAIIMHPAPVNRGVEIASSLVESERSRIFQQMTNGVYIRAAIMKHLLKEWGIYS